MAKKHKCGMNLVGATAVTFKWPAGTASSASIKICIIERSAKAFPRSSASEYVWRKNPNTVMKVRGNDCLAKLIDDAKINTLNKRK